MIVSQSSEHYKENEFRNKINAIKVIKHKQKKQRNNI